MQVQFKRPVTINGNTYGKGLHEVPDADKEDWFFAALVKDEDAVIVRDVEAKQAKESKTK